MSKLARQGRMSSQSRRGVRTATALGAVSLGLVTLSACEEPRPMMTATVGSDSVSTEAACYDDGKAIPYVNGKGRPKGELRKCLAKPADKTISVGAGDKLRIGVDPKTADAGWLVLVNGDAVLSQPLKKTYYSFPGEAFFTEQSPSGQPSAPRKKVRVTVVQSSGGDFNGIWHVNLKNTAGE
ncbi:DUF2771 domain-containing protein [Streptomyces oryzae]|uniref:DUF2771 domain-containing protein n=1 Tax=Streptomyces oryzae TaxID=1434886 RepID=A0ABS3X959_9ACTN|nr:DUF2771 domain-containing protein [Streptomyces oryzae]MBO8191903.1 DUF2771 domain-containing protein [Streptomyces oryzae]